MRTVGKNLSLRIAAVLVLAAFSYANGQPSAFDINHVEPTTAASPLRTFRGPSGLPLRTFRDPSGSIHRVRFSPDGKYLATQAEETVIWQVDTGKKCCTLRAPRNWFTDVAFSPDSKCVATAAHWDSTVRVWDAATGGLIRDYTWKFRNPTVKVVELEGGIRAEFRSPGWHYRSMEQVVFSPDGKYLVTPGNPAAWIAGMGEDDHGELRLWNVDTGKPAATFSGHQKFINVVAYCPDGKHLASGCQDGTIIVWDVSTRKPILSFQGHPKSACGLALTYSPDGRKLASVGRDGKVLGVKVWELQRLAQEGRKPSTSGREWNMTEDANVQSLRVVDRDCITPVVWSPNGKYLAFAAFSSGDKTDSFSYITVRDAGTGKQVVNLGSGKNGHPGRGVAFSPDGNQLATAHGDGTVKIWDFTKLLEGKSVGNISGTPSTTNPR